MELQAELKDYKVLITRPEPQAMSLAERVQKLGGIAIIFPCIAIVEPTEKQDLLQIIAKLSEFDLAIFISPTAVEKAMPLVRHIWPNSLKVGCIGEGTAHSLAKHQIKVDFYPKQRFNSEELLALAELQAIRGKKVVLFKGEGGKLVLEETLKLRGAEVHNAIVYARARPDVAVSPILVRWQREQFNVVVSTSQEAFMNLLTLLGEKGFALLQNTPLLVISEAMALAAKQAGLDQVILADNATDEAIINALRQQRKRLND